MKRYLAGILFCLLLLQTVLPIFASDKIAETAEKPMMIYTSLSCEEQPLGEDRPYGFVSYGLSQEGKVVADIQAVTGSGNDSQRAIRIREGSKSTYWFLYHALAYAGINKINENGQYVFSMKIKSPDANSTRRIELLYNATVPDATDYIDRVKTQFDLITIAGDIKALGQTLVESPDPNTWYEIAVAMDLNTQKAGLYLNGEKMFDVSLPAKVENVAAMHFRVPNVLEKTAKSEYYVDDFRIYAAEAPVTEAKFRAELAKYQANDWYFNEEYSAAWLMRYDKFCFQALYNRFVTHVNALRFYKDNKFYDLPFAVEEVVGTYLVPLKAFAEALGATVTWNDADSSVTITRGSDTLRCTLNSDIFYINGRISKSRYPLTTKDGNSCISLSVLELLFPEIKAYRQGDMICLDGKPVEFSWKYDELIGGTNKDGQTFEEAMTWQISMALQFRRATPEKILETYKSHNSGGQRPSLIVPHGTFDKIKEDMQTDAVLKSKVERFIASCENMLTANVVKYKLGDGIRMAMAQQLYDRGVGLSFCYRMTGDAKYKDKLWENLEAASTFPDFNPGHFLDVGNAGNGVVVAYNWLYDEWAKEPEKLETIENMMYKSVLLPIITGSKSPYILESGATFITSHSNQNCIINCAGVGAAINLMDKYPELCSNYLSASLRSSERPFSSFAPDGGYPEGTSYWNYMMMTLPYLVENFKHGVGDDFGLASAPGLSRTGYYPIMVAGTNGTFNYGDSSQTGSYDSSHQWFAWKFNDESLAVLRANNTGAFGLKDILYHIPNVDKEAEVTMQKDILFDAMDTATLRTGWTTGDMVALLHGGAVNEPHGHEDNGTFMLDAFGERWICELPKEDYNLESYGSYIYEPGMKYQTQFFGKFLRGKAEGHNTVVVNLGNNGQYDMVQTAASEIVKFDSQESGGYAICDMTQTNKVLECAFRGVKLDRALQEVILQDNFRSSEPADFRWFVNTKAQVELSEDKRTAILSKGGKRLWVSIISDDPELKFETYDAVPLPLYEHPPLQTPNDGYYRLMIHKTNTTNFKVSVAFKQLLEGQTEPGVLPVDTPMETWKFESGKADLAVLKDLTLNGETITGFSGGVNNYSVRLATEKSEIPTISATADGDYNVEIIEAKTLPGVTSILLTDDEGNQKGLYNVTFIPLNDTTKFLNDKQIPILSYEVTSEPEAENGVVNLFDANLGSKFATDESGGAVTLDFGEMVEVAEIKMAFSIGDQRKEFFTIEYSTDNMNWIMIDDNGESSGTTTDYQSFPFDPVNARYLRVRFYGNKTSGWVSVAELCAFRK